MSEPGGQLSGGCDGGSDGLTYNLIGDQAYSLVGDMINGDGGDGGSEDDAVFNGRASADSDSVPELCLGNDSKPRKFRPWKWVKRKIKRSAGSESEYLEGGGGGGAAAAAAGAASMPQINVVDETGPEMPSKLEMMLARGTYRGSVRNPPRSSAAAGAAGAAGAAAAAETPITLDLVSTLTRKLSLRSSQKELEQKHIVITESEETLIERKKSLKAILKRRISQRISIKELKEKKILHFDEYVTR